MKMTLLIVAAVALLSTLAMMNSACTTGHHSWCAPVASIRHHAKTGHS